MGLQDRNYRVTLYAFGGTITKVMSAEQMHRMTEIWDDNGADYIVESATDPVSEEVIVKTAADYEREALEESMSRHPAGKGPFVDRVTGKPASIYTPPEDRVPHDHTARTACPSCGAPPLPSRRKR